MNLHQATLQALQDKGYCLGGRGKFSYSKKREQVYQVLAKL